MNKPDIIKKQAELQGERLVQKLEARNFEAYYCPTVAEARDKALSLIKEGATVTWGGSATIAEAGLIDAVKAGNYNVIDRDTAKTPEERNALMKQAFTADCYLTSFNAVSASGVLYNIDGSGNRVAAICYGPDAVIALVGINKVCPDDESALSRARNVAAPMNVLRLERTTTACAKTGQCGNCQSDESVCSYIVETRRSMVPKRIKVIICGEELGF